MPTDYEPPVVTITSPADNTEASGSLALSASADDNQQVVQISIYADGKLRCSGTSSASCSWNLRKVASGTYTIDAEATDLAGNLGTASVTVNVTGGGSKGNSGKDSGDGSGTKGKGNKK